MIAIPFLKLHPNAHIPTKAFSSDAGWDLRAVADQLSEGPWMVVPTGIAAAIPEGYMGVIKGRSGLAAKFGVDVLGGVIDSSYRGEIKVIINFPLHHEIKAGEKIAQMLVLPVPSVSFVEVDSLENTARGERGFGASGR